VLGPRDGEHLILRGGDIFINADPSKGFNGLATGTQQVPVGVVSRFTDTSKWRKLSTSLKVAGLSRHG
jgi:hypothetical protein